MLPDEEAIVDPQETLRFRDREVCHTNHDTRLLVDPVEAIVWSLAIEEDAHLRLIGWISADQMDWLCAELDVSQRQSVELSVFFEAVTVQNVATGSLLFHKREVARSKSSRAKVRSAGRNSSSFEEGPAGFLSNLRSRV